MRRILLLVLITASCSVLVAQTRDYTRWVNPFIGTGGHGHTFPGATVPFGMVQLSPDTRIDNWDGSSGYHYSDDIIYGFSHTHLSGTGIPDGCDILFMPTIGEPQLFANSGDKSTNGYASKFSHSNEKAEPGYYSVKLDDDAILAELTATERVGFHRYTFPKADKANIVLDLKWRDRVLDSEVSFLAGPVAKSVRIEGSRASSSWSKNQRVYFVAEILKPFDSVVHKGRSTTSAGDEGRLRTTPPKATNEIAFRFKTEPDEQILVKVAISFVSIEGARANLAAELPHWDFDRVRADSKAAWNRELSKIEVSGGTDEQTTNFYTALYHTMIHPNVFNDVDGNYRGHDGKTHQLQGYAAVPPYLRRSSASPAEAKNNIGGSAAGQRRSRANLVEHQRKSGAFPQIDGQSPEEASNSAPRNPQSAIRDPQSHYTVFSLWDTFRAAHPLYTIIDQRRTVDYINSFIRMYEQGGRLPVWELWGEETDTMIGYHAVSVIADAMSKEIKGFDYEKAYKAAKHSAELDHFGLASYKKRGYISSEDENESVSKTLEYAYNDWCLMSMGSMLYNMHSFGPGPKDEKYLKQLSAEIDHYRRRSGNFQNVFDAETRFFRPRLNGGFIKPFAPQEVTFHFTEGNSWQYSFFVPHDVARLTQLMGGTSNFVAKLDELFTTDAELSGREQPDITGLIGQYAHGNEPSHHIAYLYNHAGVPSKTQHRVRKIMDEFYKPTPDGLIGNEDCGQMSAWYVLSASGFYPVVPGDGRYDIGTPLFTRVVFNLENGKKFVIRAPKVSQTNFYINSAKWNGSPHLSTYITQHHIAAGGTLDLEMTDQPNDKAFSSFSTSSVFRDDLVVPSIEGDRVFKDKTTITIRTLDRNVRIVYAINGSQPVTYTAPITIDQTSTVEAFAIHSSTGAESKKVEAHFRKRINDWSVRLVSSYSSQYTGGGDNAIVDGLRGTPNFSSGEWQGYQGKTFEGVIDLQKVTSFSTVGGGFLKSPRSWIWYPSEIVFESSMDGEKFVEIARIKPGVPPEEMDAAMSDFESVLSEPHQARYLRVRAFNFGKIPAWHLGAGGDPWIFVDEIYVR